MALSATELRIGNWVKRNEQPYGFTIDHHSFWTCEKHPEMYEPIPLTEQWLKDFGFKLSEDEGWIHNEDMSYPVYINGIRIIYKEDKFYLWIEIDEDTYYNFEWIEIKYVHQLQNLYFALTEKELTK